MAELLLPISFAGDPLGTVQPAIDLPTRGPASADPDGIIYQIHAEGTATVDQPLVTIAAGDEQTTLVDTVGPTATPFLRWAGPALARGPLRGNPTSQRIGFDAPQPNPLA